MKFLSDKPVYLSSFVILYYFLLANAADIIIPENVTIPAVLVFGDSIVDPGNNNNIKTTAKCNYPPYGRDLKLKGGKPTGRFSNGKVPGDFIAELFGIKELLPAYLDPNLQLQDLLTGVSFASGGAGYDPITAEIASAFSFSDQLDFLKGWSTKVKSAVGEERAATILSESVYIIFLGSNDISNTYPIRKLQYDINSYTDLLVNSASGFYKKLYGLGARRIGVVGVPPIGCVPSQRTLLGGNQRACSQFENQAATLFNSKLSSLIDSLNKKLPGSIIVYLDIYNPLLSLIQSPAKDGFEVATRGCCGTGKIEVTFLCNSFEDPLTCKDASKYIFWDSFHPSQKAYQILTRQVINDALNKLF